MESVIESDVVSVTEGTPEAAITEGTPEAAITEGTPEEVISPPAPDDKKQLPTQQPLLESVWRYVHLIS